MKLIHITLFKNIDSILEKGLLVDSENFKTRGHKVRTIEEAQEAVRDGEEFLNGHCNAILDHYKPKGISKYKELSKCLYFTEIRAYRKHWEHKKGKPFGLLSFHKGVIVDTKDIDTRRLFVLDNDTRTLIELIEAFKEEDEKKAREISKKYWRSLIPFKKFLEIKDELEEPKTWPHTFEFLYFKDIPPDKLTKVEYNNYYIDL